MNALPRQTYNASFFDHVSDATPGFNLRTLELKKQESDHMIDPFAPEKISATPFPLDQF